MRTDNRYADETDRIERLLNDADDLLAEQAAINLETLFRAQHREYQRLQLGWGSVARVVSAVMDWPDWRETGDPFVYEIRQFGQQYGYADVFRVLARAIKAEQQKAVA